MSELRILRCRRCATAWFPDRLWCGNCGADEFEHVACGAGRVEEVTALRRGAEGVRLGSVRLDLGPVVVARLCEGVDAGARVRLDCKEDRRIDAHPLAELH